MVSGSEAAAIKADWAKVKPDMETHGVAFFQKLLSENPAYRAKFTKFADVEPSGYGGNAAAKAQALAVFGLVDDLVNHIDDAATVKSRMDTLAGTHKGYGVGMAEFDVGFAVLLAYLGTAAGADGGAWTSLVNELKALLQANY